MNEFIPFMHEWCSPSCKPPICRCGAVVVAPHAAAYLCRLTRPPTRAPTTPACTLHPSPLTALRPPAVLPASFLSTPLAAPLALLARSCDWNSDASVNATINRETVGWNAAAASFAYGYGRLAERGFYYVGADQLVGGPVTASRSRTYGTDSLLRPTI